jgi:hypothetical protein
VDWAVTIQIILQGLFVRVLGKLFMATWYVYLQVQVCDVVYSCSSCGDAVLSALLGAGAEQKLAAGNQPALSPLASGPAGKHDHIFVSFPPSLDLLIDTRKSLSFFN